MVGHRSIYLRNGLRILLVLIVTICIVSLPEPEPESLLHYRNAVTVLVGVAIAGKLLYDTLFYDRHAR